MAKERSEAEREEKKEKEKEKKHKRSSEENGIKKHKKDKKDKKSSKTDSGDPDPIDALLKTLDQTKPGSVIVDTDGDVVIEENDDKENKGTEIDGKKERKVKREVLIGAMVPFANPLADDKTMKKVLKTVKRAAKHKTLKRGVKEVVKSLRKSAANPTASSSSLPPAIVILAADISPYDVISHIPVLCEDHNVPYVYVPSRAELGAAGSTKRPTGVVMVTPQEPKKKEGEEKKDDEKEDWSEIYADLAKVVQKAGRGVRI